jgi:hypothetical protein
LALLELASYLLHYRESESILKFTKFEKRKEERSIYFGCLEITGAREAKL